MPPAAGPDVASTSEPERGDERPRWGAEIRTAVMVAHRELIRFARARSRVVSSLVQPLVFLFILGYGLNRLVDSSGEVSFVQFLLPGAMAMSVVFSSISSGISVVWDREFGFLREMLVAPPHRAMLVAGKLAGGALVATAQGTLLLLLAPVIGISLRPLQILALVGIAALTATALTAVGVLLASAITKMQSFQAVLQVIMMPMVFLSGAIFPLRELPGWLAVITHLNPLTYAVDPMRTVALAGHIPESPRLDRFTPGLEIAGYSVPTGVSLAITAGFAIICVAASLHRFGKIE